MCKYCDKLENIEKLSEDIEVEKSLIELYAVIFQKTHKNNNSIEAIREVITTEFLNGNLDYMETLRNITEDINYWCNRVQN